MDLSREFWGQCVAVGDSDSILLGGREWRGDQSLSDGEGAAHFDLRDCSDGDFGPSLDVDRLAGDLDRIPDSDTPCDPGWMAGDSVLGRVFGGRGDSRRRGDIFLQGDAFQNIYLREVGVRRE